MATPGDDGVDQQVRLRSYQQEMLEESLKRNVIVAMDTGSGKTHIAIARIQAELELSDPGKLVWFMTPSRPLSEQQCSVLQENLPAYCIRSLTGSDNVDKWTDQHLWDAFLEGVHVVVGTPAVLADALTHAFVKISRLSLCVFDEAHRCTKRHAMNRVMRDFYHPAKLQGAEVPHILGLSASPVMKGSASHNGLAVIESNLNATIITPKASRDALDARVNKPQLVELEYDAPGPDSLSSLSAPLSKEMSSYDLDQDPYVLELKSQGDERELSKTREKGKTVCREQLQGLLNRAENINQNLGPIMADWFICTCTSNFISGCQDVPPTMLDLQTREKSHMAKILRRITFAGPDCTITSRVDQYSTKAQMLHKLLLDCSVPGFRGIVFVEQRALVSALAHLLRSLPDINERYKIGTFVSTSTHASRKTSLTDSLSDPKTQAQDYSDFRSGSKNLIIATAVLEEGIDIPACNAVICFDFPKDLVAFVQRRGRARMADSKYVLFIDRNDLKTDPGRLQQLEEKTKEAYMDENRAIDATAGAEEVFDDTSHIRYSVESTGALLTVENAKGHLHHFCAVSTRNVSRYIDPGPEFDTSSRLSGKSELWKASVTLPSFVHSSIRTAQSREEWHSESTAIQEAAFNTYIALHKAGLVNDNLLPVVKDYRPDVGQQHIDQPSLVHVAERLTVWDLHKQLPAQSMIPWHATETKLHLKGLEVVSQVLWLPFTPVDPQRLQLHWNATTKYEASITPLDLLLPLDENGKPQCAEWTSIVLRSVFPHRIPTTQKDFAFLLSPPQIHKHDDLVGIFEGHEIGPERLASAPDTADYGLIRVLGQEGKAYIAQAVVESASSHHDMELSEGDMESKLAITPFPKRRDFLHLPAQTDNVNDAYATVQTLPLSQCMVSRLPSKYAILAAFLPCILHQLDITATTQHLIASTLEPVKFENVDVVVQALSSPAANEPVGDYNRLEYLGDSILKFCTELQVVAQHLTWPEAYLSAEKDRIVRNTNLAKASLEAGLDRYLLTKPFTGSKWQPPSLNEMEIDKTRQREISSKVLADVVEALIGAAFVDGGLSKAYTCITTLLPAETWNDHSILFDSILEEHSQPAKASLGALEKLVGHHFTHPSLLVEAVTHASHPINRSGLSYERLEFLGDAVLDLIVTPKLFAHPRKLRHWDLHRVHEALVNSHILGFCCLAISCEEEFNDINTTDHRLPTVEHNASKQTYHLYDFIRASAQLAQAKQASIARFQELRNPIARALRSDALYPWPDLIALQPEKFFSDIVESILGALYIDTRGDRAVCEAFLEKLGILPMLRDMLDRGVETAFPKERVGLLADREEVKYVVERTDGEEGKWDCGVLVGGREVARARRCATEGEAEVRAADVAARALAVESEGRVRKKKLEVCRFDGCDGFEAMDEDES